MWVRRSHPCYAHGCDGCAVCRSGRCCAEAADPSQQAAGQASVGLASRVDVCVRVSYERPSWAEKYHEALAKQVRSSAGDLLAHEVTSALAHPLSLGQEAESLTLCGYSTGLKARPETWLPTVLTAKTPLALPVVTDHITLDHLMRMPQSKEDSDG
jgi:hypothetical protein